MLLIFGTRAVEDLLRTIVFVCHYCGVRADQRVIRMRNRFALFFIPLFTFSTRYMTECTNCGGLTDISRDEAEGRVRWAGNTDQQ